MQLLRVKKIKSCTNFPWGTSGGSGYGLVDASDANIFAQRIWDLILGGVNDIDQRPFGK